MATAVPARRVAVLGAGIMGASTALLLARRGMQVHLFDAAPVPFAGASRWNEGKIHLGHLYTADPTLATARRLLPGGLAFRALVEDLIGCPLSGPGTDDDDTYVVHRDSVVDADAVGRYLEAATALVREHARAGDYFRDLRHVRARRLPATELEARYDTRTVVAGFRVPERSVATSWVADRFVEALRAQASLHLHLGTRVRDVRRDQDAGPLRVLTSRGEEGPFAVVVNALWEDRLRIDAGLGLAVPDERSHRYRLSVFLRTTKALDLPSTVVATGPFGDLKNYGGREFYLSWYPEGLRAEGHAVSPPPMPTLEADNRASIAGRIVARLDEVIPGVAGLPALAESLQVEGGWVYASGDGSLADREASLHRRDRVGIFRSGGYFSVDTGKYSIAPWLAQGLAGTIAGD